eukprot:14745930-Heterocapsa_arctica.AAC.1
MPSAAGARAAGFPLRAQPPDGLDRAPWLKKTSCAAGRNTPASQLTVSYRRFAAAAATCLLPAYRLLGLTWAGL